MNILECLIEEKKYLSFLKKKKNILEEETKTLSEENRLLTKEITKLSKKEFELKDEINHYENVDKIIKWNTFMKFITTLIITVLVIKFIPDIYANLLQDLILIPFYFYEVITWYKATDKEVNFKNNYKIVNKRMDIHNLEVKMKKLKEKLKKHEDKLKIITNELKDISNEEERHTKYINNLKDILDNYYLETLKNYLGEELINKINYPTSPSLKLEKKKTID